MKPDQEIWRPVPSLPGFEASSLGKVRGFYLQPMPHGGSKQVSFGPTYGTRIWSTGLFPWRMIIVHRRKSYKVHRLVCEAFHGTPEEGMEVLHRNECSIDNRASNLRWGTRKENMNAPGLKAYQARVCPEKMAGKKIRGLT